MALAQVKKPERRVKRRDGQCARLAVRFDEAHEHEAAPIGAAAQFSDCGGTLTRAVHQHAALEDILVDQARKYGPRQSDSHDRPDRSEEHDSAPHPQRRNDVPNHCGHRNAGHHRGNHAHDDAEGARALAGAVQTKGQQAQHHHDAKDQRARPQWPVDALEPQQIAAEAHVGGENECHAAHRKLDDCEHRDRDVHVLTDQTKAHRTAV